MNFKMKYAAVALALAGVFDNSQAANVSLSGSDFPFSFGADPSAANTYSVAHAPGSFTDVFTFSLSHLSDTVASAVSLFLPGVNGAPSSYEITGSTLSLFSDPGGDGLAGTNTKLAMVAFGSGNGTLAVNNVAAGSYFWELSGNAVGVHGGAYLYSTDTAPVPEPGTYAMMLAGLGLLGFIAKRRLDQTPLTKAPGITCGHAFS